MIIPLIAQIPTPTYIPPPETPMLIIPEHDISVWSYADDTVGVWNMFRDYTPAIQWGVLFVLVIVGVFFFIKKIRELNEDGANDS